MGYGYSGGRPIEVEDLRDFPTQYRPGEPNTQYYLGNTIVETDAKGEPVKQKSWDAIRAAHWKARAKEPEALKKWGQDNLDLMKKGNSPIMNGQKIVLHHPEGKKGDNIWNFIEMPKNEHIAFHKEHGYHFWNEMWNKRPNRL